MITETEQQYINYIKANKNFITKFHSVYYVLYKQKLNSYDLKDYMIANAIQVNKLEGYNDYTEFYNAYLEALGNNDITDGACVYDECYELFKCNMNDEIQKLKERFNKNDEDIYIAYCIKTIWNFYIGFMIEKLIKVSISKETNVTLMKREEAEQRLIDNTMAIDVEVTSVTNTIGLQIKSHTYLSIGSDLKDKHIQKQNKYKAKYNSEAYYVLYNDYLPIYKTNGSYLFTQNDIKELTGADTTKGTYEGLVNDLKDKLSGTLANII